MFFPFRPIYGILSIIQVDTGEETGMDVLEVIRTQYACLSRAQKKIADYILERPEDACFASLKELTEAVGETEVTMMNFARRIGIDGFSGLKRELQDYIRQRLSPNQKIARAVETVRRRKNSLYSEFLENELAAISSTYAGVSEEQLVPCCGACTPCTAHLSARL